MKGSIMRSSVPKSNKAYAELKQIYLADKDAFVLSVLNLLGNQQAAEDAVHDAYIKLIQNIDKFNEVPADKQEGYVFACVQNAARDIYRKNRRLNTLSLPEGESCDANSSAEAILISNESLGEIRSALADLDETSYAILLASIWFEESDAEIAARYNISEAALRVRRHRIRKKLNNILGKGGPGHDKA